MMNREEIEDLMEEFNVKPMTKGLGFHHSLSEKKDLKTNLDQQKNALLSDLENRSHKMYRQASSTPRYQKKETFNMGELSAFYEKSEPQTIDELPSLIENENLPLTSEASLTKRFMAWTIDVSIVGTMLCMAMTLVLLFTDLSFQSFNNISLGSDLIISFSLLYVLFYLFYFSFLDKTRYSTLGKRLLGIQVDADLNDLDYVATFARASLSVFSVLTFGLFTLLTLHDSFTGTRVVRSNESL